MRAEFNKSDVFVEVYALQLWILTERSFYAISTADFQVYKLKRSLPV